MARTRKKRTYRRGGFKMPVAVVGGFLPLLVTAAADVRTQGIAGLQNTVSAIIPYNPATRQFTMARLGLGLYPIIIGFLVHKIAGAMGINRALAAARVPFIRI